MKLALSVMKDILLQIQGPLYSWRRDSDGEWMCWINADLWGSLAAWARPWDAGQLSSFIYYHEESRAANMSLWIIWSGSGTNVLSDECSKENEESELKCLPDLRPVFLLWNGEACECLKHNWTVLRTCWWCTVLCGEERKQMGILIKAETQCKL